MIGQLGINAGTAKKYIKQSLMIQNIMRKLLNISLISIILCGIIHTTYIWTTNDTGIEFLITILIIFGIFCSIVSVYMSLSKNMGAWVLTTRKERKQGMDWWVFLEPEEVKLRQGNIYISKCLD